MRKLASLFSVLLVLLLFSSVAWAEEANQSLDLKLNQALDLALKNSDSLKKSAMDTKKAEENRKTASDNVDYIPAGSVDNPSADSVWYTLLTQDLSWQMSKKTYTAEEDRLILSTCQKYWNIQKSLESVKIKELSVKQAQLVLSRAQLMVRLGMTPTEYSTMSPAGALAAAQASLAGAKSDLENAKNEVNSNYESLNQLIGLSSSDRPKLSEEIKFEALPETDLDVAVQHVIGKSPSIWLAEEKINLAKYAYEKMFATGQYTSYEVRKIEKQQAEIDAATAKDATDLATRGLYYTVRNLEASRPALENSVKTAEESLRVAKLQYELGMITMENMVKAEAALEDAKQNLMNLDQQHCYYKLAFQKPWAVSSSQ